MQTFRFDRFSVQGSKEWTDISDQFPNGPYTLERRNPDGAFQISPAFFTGGKRPNPTIDDLLEMGVELGRSKNAGEGFDAKMETGDILIAGISFHLKDDFVRVWNISDGENFARLTYLQLWGRHELIAVECEQMVRSFQFQA